MLITVVIATLNRPALLIEAVQSVASQSYGDWEVVVVDDGSMPPVDVKALASVLGDRFTAVRHATTQGVPEAKNAGLRAASGEVIMHLDDDDLLAENALESVAKVFHRYKQLDCVFLNAEPFGRFARGSAENQAVALSKLRERVCVREEDGVIFLGDGLFQALLKSVPLALQRPAARRGTWNIVGEYSSGLLFSEPDWTIRASLCCQMALLREPLSRWRCDGQNFASKPEMRLRAIENGVRAAELLFNRLGADQAQQLNHLRLGRRFLADAYFSRAYEAFHADGHCRWRDLYRSVRLAPGWRHLNLGIRNAFGKARR